MLLSLHMPMRSWRVQSMVLMESKLIQSKEREFMLVQYEERLKMGYRRVCSLRARFMISSISGYVTTKTFQSRRLSNLLTGPVLGTIDLIRSFVNLQSYDSLPQHFPDGPRNHCK